MHKHLVRGKKPISRNFKHDLYCRGEQRENSWVSPKPVCRTNSPDYYSTDRFKSQWPPKAKCHVISTRVLQFLTRRKATKKANCSQNMEKYIFVYWKRWNMKPIIPCLHQILSGDMDDGGWWCLDSARKHNSIELLAHRSRLHHLCRKSPHSTHVGCLSMPILQTEICISTSFIFPDKQEFRHQETKCMWFLSPEGRDSSLIIPHRRKTYNHGRCS